MGEKLEKIKSIFKKDKKLPIILLLAILGIIFIFFSEFSKESKNNENNTEETSDSADFYASTTEEKLRKIISSIEGAGETDVMVTVETGEENVYAKEIKSNEESNDSKSISNYEYEYIVIKSGTSSESGMLLKVVQPNIRGVAVVCDGGDNAAVRENIISTVSAVLDIKTNKISVCKRKS